MNIKAYGSSAAELAQLLSSCVADTTKTSNAATNTQKGSTEDTITLASGASSVRALVHAAFDTSSRDLQVASLQKAIRSGQYTIDPARLAAALVKAHI